MGKPGKASRARKAGRIKVDLVVARYNEEVTRALYEDARRTLLARGLSESDLRTFWVPGAMEIPQVFSRLIQKPRADAAIGIGCVIRGETSHHHQVGRAAIDGIARLSLISKIPLIACILTVENKKQAHRRTFGPVGRKGREAAGAALDMIEVYEHIKKSR